MNDKERVKNQLRKDLELIRKNLPKLLGGILTDQNLQNMFNFSLVFRPDMKTAICKRGENEIHFGTQNEKLKNLKISRKTLLHESIHALGVDHSAKMRSLNFYSNLSRDIFTNKIMEKLGWKPPNDEDIEKYFMNKENYRYIAYCPDCGNKWYRKRKSKLIKNPQKYYCKKCETSLKSKETNIK